MLEVTLQTLPCENRVVNTNNDYEDVNHLSLNVQEKYTNIETDQKERREICLI